MKTSRSGCQRIAERSAWKSDTPFSLKTTTSPSTIADVAGSAAAASTIGRVLRRPVEAAPRQSARLAALDDELCAIAIMFDFVNPAVAFRRRVGRLGSWNSMKDSFCSAPVFGPAFGVRIDASELDTILSIWTWAHGAQGMMWSGLVMDHEMVLALLVLGGLALLAVLGVYLLFRRIWLAAKRRRSDPVRRILKARRHEPAAPSHTRRRLTGRQAAEAVDRSALLRDPNDRLDYPNLVACKSRY